MSKFNQNYVKAIKYFILSGSEKVSNLKKNQNDHLQQITHGKNLECSALEIFDEDEFFKVTFIEKCETIIDTIPIILFKNEFHDKILNFNKFSSKCLMNIGLRVSLNERKKLIFEEWRNIIDKENKDSIIFSLHKTYSDDKYELKLNYNNCTYLIEILLYESTDINNLKYVEYKDSITIWYSSSSVEDNHELLTNLLYENTIEKNTETLNEKIYYTKNKMNNNLYNINEEEMPITINQVESETTKKEENYDYFERNYEIYFIDPHSKKKWGKKNYENNKKRKYDEDWEHYNLDNNGFEEKYHKYLDDGCGKQTTEDHGKKMLNEDELDYEYTDKYIYEVSTGDELTTKIGCDRYNKWNCYNMRNRIKNFSHVKNEASNSQNKMEWKEKWDEEGNIKTCTKWGKSEDEEWEESWKEIYEPEKDFSEKTCYKKCKKLNEDKEWYETWTEKNDGKPNCEKTCYKMNREGGNKYENYWGNIILNYLENKRMNYVGYINNNDKKEFVNYS